MKHAVETLNNLQLTEKGVAVLPKNFDSLSVKKQKQAVVESFVQNLMAINNSITRMERTSQEAKNLQELLYKKTVEGRKFIALKKEIAALKKEHADALSGRAWMMRMARDLGFDVSAELKNMKLIEAE